MYVARSDSHIENTHYQSPARLQRSCRPFFKNGLLAEGNLVSTESSRTRFLRRMGSSRLSYKPCNPSTHDGQLRK
jgi:hypothetical protein